jgi:hypothetical protein
MANIVEQISDAFRGQRTRAFLSDGTRDVIFNSTLKTTETDTNKVTSHAIEQGADVTDHVIESPKDFSFTAVLSDNDLQITNPSAFFEATIEDRKQIFDKWLKDKTILTYYGHETDIENVVIKSITRNKSANFGEGLGLDIKIKKINVVESAEVEIDFEVVTKKGRTAKKTDKNNATTSDTAVKKKSWLSAVFG